MKIWGLGNPRGRHSGYMERWYAAQYKEHEYVFCTDLPTRADFEVDGRWFSLKLAELSMRIHAESILEGYESGKDISDCPFCLILTIDAEGNKHFLRMDSSDRKARFVGNPMRAVAIWAIQNFPQYTNPDKR